MGVSSYMIFFKSRSSSNQNSSTNIGIEKYLIFSHGIFSTGSNNIIIKILTIYDLCFIMIGKDILLEDICTTKQ